MGFRKWADFLWPIGATVLSLLVMPLAIEQYPGFFKENRWPLPISVGVVVVCWILPFCLHERAKGIVRWSKSEGWIGISLVALIALSVLMVIAIGAVRLFRFHTTHLDSVLHKKEIKPESSEQKHEESKKESPNVKNPPAPLKLPKSKNVFPQKDEPPFSVSVEWAMFSIGGKGYGTGFWAYYPAPTGCTIAPVKAVFFVRVKNLRSTPITVIGYSLDVFGVPLTRTNMGSIVRIPQKASSNDPKRPNGYPINRDIHFGQGPGFSMVQFPLNEADFTQGFVLQMELIESLLKAPLQPNIPVRGWAFYQSPNENAFSLAGPGHITLETDDARTFSYDFDLKNPHPELDILERVITAKSFIDLSDCKRP